MKTQAPDHKPLYRQISDRLRARILSGEWPADSIFPTELDLCVQESISRHTAREALRLLVEEGLLVRRRGAGSQVRPRPATPFIQPLDSIGAILQYARDVRLDVERYELESKNNFWTLDGLRRNETGDVIALTTITVLARLAPPRDVLEILSGAILEWIEDTHAVRVHRVQQTLDAVRLSAAQAANFGLPPDTAALRTVRVYQDQIGEELLRSVSLHPEGRFSYTFDLTREKPQSAP
jgi:DNA-binding GntR family transcriptional regulator